LRDNLFPLGLSVVLIEKHDLGQVIRGAELAGISGYPAHQGRGLIVHPALDQAFSEKGIDLRGDYGIAVLFKAGEIAKGMAAQGTVEILLEVGPVIGLGELFDQSGKDQKAQSGIQVLFLRGHRTAIYGPVYSSQEI